MKNKKVVIVGAGMAGASAAFHIQKAGLEVVVLEARGRIGGRIHTDTSWGFPIELGANWIHHPHDNPLKALAEDFAIQTQTTDYDNVRVFDRHHRRISILRLLFMNTKYNIAAKKAARFMASSEQDCSLYEAMRMFLPVEKLTAKEKEVLSFFDEAYESGLATSLKDISAKNYFASSASVVEQDLLVTGGFGEIVHTLLANVDVRLACEVREIHQKAMQHHTSFVRVMTDSQTFEADYVIVTVPLGVLQNNGIVFSPGLPEKKINALHTLKTSVMNKVVMRFEEKFWNTNSHFLAFVGESYHNRGIVLNYHRFTKHPILVAMPVDKAAIAFERQPTEEIQRYWQTVLHKAYPNKSIEFAAIMTTDWHGDRFSQGSYMHMPVGATHSDINAVGQAFGRIHFAGEATTAEYHSYTHGAYISGRREAEVIIHD